MITIKGRNFQSVNQLAAGCSCICSPGGHADAENFGGEGWCAAYCGCGGPSGTVDNREANLNQAYRNADVQPV